MKNRLKSSFFLKPLATLLLAFGLLCPLNQSEAAAWPAIDPIIRTGLNKITDIINGIMIGAAKDAAIKALNQEVDFMITGRSSGGAMFVTNWNSYLIKTPQTRANIFINDYISQATRGRGSISGYISATGEGVGGSFISQMTQGAKASTSDRSLQPKVTYQGNPSRMFAGPKPFQNLNLYLSGVNNPWAFNLSVQMAYQEKLQDEKFIEQTKVVAGQGFPGTEKDGQTVTPGSVVKEQVTKVKNMGLDMIATAENLPELITSAVSMTISQTMLQGIGNIQASVHREVSNVRQNAKVQINAAIKTSGPGAMYGR